MASERQSQAWPPYPVAPWPPDDTEESILGTDLHQTTITNLRLGINQAARVGRRHEEPSLWRAFTQIALLGCTHRDGTAYRTIPDVFVYHLPDDRNRGSIAIDVEGPPLLIVEVLSESTYESDIDLVKGKGYSYAHVGVLEYLVLDPTGEFLRDGIRGWRLIEGTYRPWEPAPDGRHFSTQLPIAFHLEGAMAVVSLREGRHMLREDVVEEELARNAEELARLRRLLSERS